MLSSHPQALILAAAEYAAESHRGQTRKGLSRRPYVEHVLSVAGTLASNGVDDPVALAAALLHDTIEDCGKTRDELARRFGERVADVVVEVSDDGRLSQAQRKQKQIDTAPWLSREARLVKLADKINNVREVGVDPGEGWTDARRREYVAWSRRVVEAMPPTHPGLERLFDEQCEATLACIDAQAHAASLT
jgi:guanosine-3',5'-bis(diphosphate) 3'-pyrophosphohydrolase